MRAARRILDPAVSMSVAKNKCALGVMTKVPRAGHVKTRLIPPLSPEDAALLNICFLRDTAAAIATACDAGAIGVAVYTPAGEEAAYNDILPEGFLLLPQRGDGFGERLNLAANDLFRCGFESICLIDSDSPTVPADNFAEAVRLLGAKDDRVVLGPSDDGGYYLIGLRRYHPELFEQIDWSTERVLDQTIQRAEELGLAVELLPNCYDVDDRASLHRLCTELLGNQRSTAIVPHTRKFLASLSARVKL